MLQLKKILHVAMKMHAATKTQYSQINKYFLQKKFTELIFWEDCKTDTNNGYKISLSTL